VVAHLVDHKEKMMSRERVLGEGFELEVDVFTDHLRFRVFGGADSLALSLAYWTAIWALVERTGITNLLVLEDLEPFPDAEPSVFEAAVAHLVKLGFCRTRIAFVDLKEETQANEYGLLLSNEQGIAMMMFSNEQYAERWLRFGADAPLPSSR